MSEARRARRLAQRSVGKAIKKRDLSMRAVRADLFREQGVDLDAMRRQAAQTRREFDLCLHDDDIRLIGSDEDAAKCEDEPRRTCELCGKVRLRIPIVAAPWLAAKVSPAAREAFMKGLLK